MDFQETSIQKDLRELARRFAQNELASIVEQDEREERFRTEQIQKLGDVGLTGISVPEGWGGSGLGISDSIVVIEELAACCLGYAISVSVTGLVQTILQNFGDAQQKQKYIPPLAHGKAIGAFSLSEAGSGSDAASLRTTARREGDFYLLNGTKSWITQGDFADTLIVMARTGEAGPSGISAFIVEKGMEGFEYGKRERKMGCHTSHTMELLFHNVKVPVAHRIGQEGEGFKIAMAALDSGRINIGAAALGIAGAALQTAIFHAKQREQFGKPIGEFQAIAFMLADMTTQLQASRLLVQKAAWLKDKGEPFSVEAAMAKFYSTDMAMQVTTDAVQILGGAGYTQDFPVERWMREAKVLQIVEGTNQIQRLVVGRSMTRSL